MARVSVTYEDHIARVTLTRGDKMNALDDAMVDAILEAGAEVAASDARVVVLSGEGKSFCAGLDLASFAKMGQVDPESWLMERSHDDANRMQEVAMIWRRVPVPVIAAVHGHCLGGGLQVALAADFRVATPDSQWSVLEGKWGIIPDMSGVRSLKELVGIDVAKKLTMTAEVVSGKEARDLGLVTSLDSDPVAAALEMAEHLKGRSPDQLAAAKRLFDDTWTAGPRYTFFRERVEQAWLLAARNTAVARKAAFARVVPEFGPRGR